MAYNIVVTVLNQYGSVPASVISGSNSYTVTVQTTTPAGDSPVTYSSANNSFAMQIATVMSGYTGSQGPQTKAFNVFCSGKPANNEYIGGGLSPYAITINASSSVAKALMASTGNIVFSRPEQARRSY